MQLSISKKINLKNDKIQKTIYENTKQCLKFNVMPDKHVYENLSIKKYIISNNKIEAYFNREYYTDMLKSPNHYIFLSSLVNLQKMIYVLMCNHFDIKYNPYEKEKFKIWPTKTNIEMNGMIRKQKKVCQDFKIENFDEISTDKYLLKGISTSESIIKITGDALVYKI